MGGIASVVNVYREAHLFDRLSIIYMSTHCSGTPIKKIGLFFSTWFCYLLMLLQARIALIHVHTAADVSFWRKTMFICPALCFRVPSIIHLHAGRFPEFYEQRCNGFSRWIVRYIFDHVDSIIVVSLEGQRWVKSISRNQLVVPIYNAIQVAENTDFTLRENASVLCLGRLGRGKGTYDLLEAVCRIVGKYPQIRVILGGDGELGLARDAAKRLGIDKNVEILGWVSGADKSRLLERATIYALPSYAEGLPMSVLEAMSAGLPVVSTAVGGIPEAITDGVEGSLVLPGDVAALSAAIDRLLSDDGLRRKMGLAARQKVNSTFSTECILPMIERLYRQLGVVI